MWEKVEEGVKWVAIEVVCESKSNMPEDKQKWWWVKEVKEIKQRK